MRGDGVGQPVDGARDLYLADFKAGDRFESARFPISEALIVEFEPTDALVLSGRNLPGVRVLDPSHVTVYDVLDCQHVLLTSEGLLKLEERLA